MRRWLIWTGVAAAGAIAATAAASLFRPLAISFPARSARREVPAAGGILGVAYTAADRVHLWHKDRVTRNHVEFSENVLLIRDLTGQPFSSYPAFDHDRGEFGLRKLVERALCAPVASCGADAEQALRTWANLENYTGFGAFRGEWGNRPLNQIPLRLLAILPRFDLAVIRDDRSAKGAELRFVYASVHGENGPNFSVILEFTLRTLSDTKFFDLLTDWVRLESSPDATTLSGRLDATLPLAESARLRVNGASSGFTWYFSQFAAKGAFAPEPVDRQPCEFSCLAMDYHCVKAESPLSRFLSRPGIVDCVRTSDYRFPADIANLQAQEVGLPQYRPTVLTLDRKAITGQPDVDRLRFTLSINSCTGCHGWEGQGGFSEPHTGFDHIKYNPGKTAKLSRFLTGCAKDTDSAADCSPEHPEVGLWQVHPRILAGPGCPTAADAAPRSFNDLLRRHLYFDTILNDPPKEWKDKLERYKLIAFESH